MKNLVLFGMQGSGKGTQGAFLKENYGFKVFETGSELRRLMKEDSDLGRTVQEIVQRGDLVPNEIVMEIISEFLEETPPETPVLFDGIPRSIPQKETFDELLETKGRPIFGIFIGMTTDEAIERLMARGRSDDNEAAITKRLENYETETIPVIQAYENAGIMTRVNGVQSIENVAIEIDALVKQEVL